TGQFAISVEALEARTGDLAAPVKEITVSVSPAVTATIEPAAAPASITRNFNLPAVKPDADKPAIAQPIAATGPIATAPIATGTLSAGPPKPDSAMPIPAPIEKTSMIQADQSQELLRSGDKLMGLGELIAARQFYAKALDRGLSQAALKLGQTYDPAVFADKNGQALKPDPAMAMKYSLQA